MPSTPAVRLRNLCWSVHRWIGLLTMVLLVPIALSGALLVWHHELDALLHPARYAVTSGTPQPPSVFLVNAQAALPNGPQVNGLRFPLRASDPTIVTARGPRQEGAPPPLLNIYLDPATGRVLDVVDFHASLFGFLHRFHENLTLPAYSGRAIVGWAGAGMLILSLMSSVAPMSPQLQRPGLASPSRTTHLSADAALAGALAFEPAGRPVAVFVPTAADRRDGAGDRPGPADSGAVQEVRTSRWRVQLGKPGDRRTITLLVNDSNGAVERLPDPFPGDRAAQWIRAIHEGSRGGVLWQLAVFLTGVLPMIFALTGLIMWMRGRPMRKSLVHERPAAALRPAE